LFSFSFQFEGEVPKKLLGTGGFSLRMDRRYMSKVVQGLCHTSRIPTVVTGFLKSQNAKRQIPNAACYNQNAVRSKCMLFKSKCFPNQKRRERQPKQIQPKRRTQ